MVITSIFLEVGILCKFLGGDLPLGTTTFSTLSHTSSVKKAPLSGRAFAYISHPTLRLGV